MTEGNPKDSDDLANQGMVELELRSPVWNRVFTVAPLVVIGTREGDGYNLAPKHMALPLGWEGYFGFVCTPTHSTYVNAREYGAFTVSFPGVDQVVITSLTAEPRCGDGGEKPTLISLPTRPAQAVEGRVLRDAHLVLECELDRIVEGFGDSELVVGRIVAARAHPLALRKTEVDDAEILRQAPVLAYLSPGRFAKVQSSQLFPLPEGFQR